MESFTPPTAYPVPPTPSVTDAEYLALVEAAIEARLNGDAYEEYQEGADRFRGTSLESLNQLRDNLKAKLAADGTSGASFRLADPFDV